MADKVTYPDMPGWKGNKSTGIQAAFAVSQDLARRHRQVFDALAPYGAAGATCDEICEALGLPVHIVRPRASELERKGKLYPVGKRRGAMGYNVTIYSTVRPAEPVGAAA